MFTKARAQSQHILTMKNRLLFHINFMSFVCILPTKLAIFNA